MTSNKIANKSPNNENAEKSESGYEQLLKKYDGKDEKESHEDETWIGVYDKSKLDELIGDLRDNQVELWNGTDQKLTQ